MLFAPASLWAQTEADYPSVIARAALFSESEKLFIKSLQHVNLCVDPSRAPLQQIDNVGNYQGVIADALKVVSEQTAIPFRVVPTESWQASLAALRNRRCDVLASYVGEPSSADNFIKTVSYLLQYNVFVTRVDAPVVLNFSALRDQSVAVLKGYPNVALLHQHYPALTLVEVDRIEEALKMVARGKVFAFADILPTALYALQKLKYEELHVAGYAAFPVEQGMAVRDDMPMLVSIMNKALEQLDAKLLNELLAERMQEYKGLPFTQREIIIAGLVMTLVFGLVLFSNRKLYRMNRRLDRANTELALINETDALTNLKNRNFLAKHMPGLVKMTHRHKLTLGIAVLDIDHFKRINDSYGHSVGDRCLVGLAGIMKNIFQRETDWCVRYGGEEFLIVCTGIYLKEFYQKLENLRLAAEHFSVRLPGNQHVRFTISCGYVCYKPSPEQWSDNLVVPADKKLYEAKAAGRNRVIGDENRKAGTQEHSD